MLEAMLERPVKRLPAPGLETTSAIKQQSASAGSGHPNFPPGTGIPAGISGGLGDRFGHRTGLAAPRSAWSGDMPWLTVSHGRTALDLARIWHGPWHGGPAD